MHLSRKITTALVFTLVTIVVSGCCMKRDIVIVDDKINKIRADQKEMKDAVNRLDSLIIEESEASLKLRADIRSSVNELIEQFRITQANISDLQDKITFLAERESGHLPVMPPIVKADSADTTVISPVVPGIDCQKLYDESFINIMRGHYEEAIQGLTDYLNYCGTQELADNARFWIGESYFSMDKYQEAIDEFDRLLKEFPNSEKHPGALYKMARSYEELGRKNDAKRSFEKLVDEFPRTLEAEQAKEKLKEL